VGLADRNHPGGQQPVDARRRVIGNAAEPALRSRRRLPALHFQQILERDRQSVQRSPRGMRAACEVGRVGELQRIVAIDVDERVQLAVQRIDAGETRLDDGARRRLATRKALRERGQRRKRKVVGHGTSGEGIGGPLLYNARHAGAVLTTSEYCQSAIRRHYGIAPSQVRLVPEGIDVARWRALAARVPHQSDGATILCVARQYPRKHIADLLRALPAVRSAVPRARAEFDEILSR